MFTYLRRMIAEFFAWEGEGLSTANPSQFLFHYGFDYFYVVFCLYWAPRLFPVIFEVSMNTLSGILPIVPSASYEECRSGFALMLIAGMYSIRAILAGVEVIFRGLRSLWRRLRS